MNILRAILFTALVSACGIEAPARSAADFFKSAPDEVMPMLPYNTRLDMIDYFRFGSSTPSSNYVGGSARVTAEGDLALDYIQSERVRGTVAVIPTSGDTIVALITTMRTPVPDSEVTFYDKDWQPLDRQPLVLPHLADWLLPEASRSVADEVPFVLAEATYISDGGGSIVFVNRMAQYYAPSDTARIMGEMRREISYKLKGKKFVKDK